MGVEKHDLIYEIPESKESIRHLKANDTRFADLYNQYQEVERDVHRFELGAENTSDDHLEDLKKQRLHLKDQLFGMIRKYEESANH